MRAREFEVSVRRIGRSGSAGVLAGGLALAFALALACTDETVIEVERPFFQDPPNAAMGFLGYDDAAANLTVCGNCHVGQQSRWENTRHADAWAGLQASGNVQPFCEGCHTVNPLGNPAVGEGGWTTTQDPRYHDVQCESCHGPGATHVANPDVDANHPLALIKVGADLTAGCGECHQGEHHPFVEEWEQSKHAEILASPAGNPSCAGCHEGNAILAGWGVTDDYVEKHTGEQVPIVCAVCHDPHEATNQGQLRFPVNSRQIEVNLCARCHNRRTAPLATSTHGLEPHAPEAPLLLGDAGWFPPNAEIDQGQIISTHGSEGNPNLCATCHVAMFPVNDPNTGGLLVNSVGHLFEAIPCVDAQGIPIPGGDCPLTTAARSFAGCATGACHGGQQASAAGALIATRLDIADRAADLLALLTVVDPNLTAPGGAIDPTNPTFTVAEGALFNYNLATHGGDVTASTAHNPFLIRALLIASEQAVEEEYGVMGNRGFVDHRAELREVIRQAPRR